MKKRIFFLLFFILIFVLPVFADSEIDSIYYSAEVSSSCKVTVTLTAQMYFDTAETTVSLPLPGGTVSKVSVQGYRTKVTETDGQQFATITGSFVGTQSFVLTYQQSDVLPEDDTDTDDLTLEMLSSAWARDIGAFTYQVLLPSSSTALSEDFSYTQEVSSGYTGALEEEDFNGTVNGTLLSGELESLMAYESLSITVPLPEGYFYIRKTTIPGVSVGILSAIMGLILLLCIVYWWFRIRTRHLEVSERMLLPEGAEPYQLSQILHCSEPDFASLILLWANLGYLNIRISKRGTLYLEKQLDIGTERSAAEQKLFRRIFARTTRAPIYPEKYSAAAEQFVNTTTRILNRYMLDKKGGNISFIEFPLRLLFAFSIGYTAYAVFPEGTIYMIISFVLGLFGMFMVVNMEDAFYMRATDHQYTPLFFASIIILVVLSGLSLFYGSILEMAISIIGIMFSVYAQSMGPRRSEKGNDLRTQVLGCRNAYRKISWNKIRNLHNKDNQFFLKQLPMIVSLREAKVFAKRFDRIAIPRPTWMPKSDKKAMIPKDFYKELKPIMKQIRKSFQ